MTELQTADAQFSVAHVLKPFEGFITAYEGQSGLRPIAFPGNLDPDAKNNTQGFDPNLIAGVPVPLGSRVLIWIPTTPQVNLQNTVYRYQLLWRLRNLRDYQQNRAAYHLSRQSVGANNQFVIPAAVDSIPLPDPTTPIANPMVVQLGNQLIDLALLYSSGQPTIFDGSGGLSVISPRTGNPEAAVQQGVVPTGVWENNTAFFNTYSTVCKGDELIILATKADTSNWNFNTGTAPQDFGFGSLYSDLGVQNPGSRDAGIYVFTGANAT